MRRSKSKRGGKRPGGGQELLPWSESVAYQLRDTYRAFAQILKRQLEHLDINLGGWPYLRILWREDGLTQRELTRRSGLMQPNTNAALKQLSKRGLIVQKEDPHDRRRINIYLTPQGRAISQHLIPLALQVRERALTGITRAEFLLLLDLLARMKSNLGARNQADAGGETRLRKSKLATALGRARASRK
jgi:MarR family transcriptional regulator, organic hydroperoxide resistance regulator